MKRNLSIIKDIAKHETISKLLKEKFSNHDRKLNILEAGCGRKWCLDISPNKYTLTGVDLSEEALKIRSHIEKDLDEILVGDLKTIDFPEETYDIIYCAYVLEHMEDVEDVLKKAEERARANGRICYCRCQKRFWGNGMARRRPSLMPCA